ncbi:MAG TPA: hypothetical protein DEH65_00100, partial [Delftia acidovorans]|nr:hypothetical protein [Delftia acidovorans]
MTAIQERARAPVSSARANLKMLVRYKAWANGLTFKSVMELPEGEALKQRTMLPKLVGRCFRASPS